MLVEGADLCGLLYGHQGACTRWMPGGYLPLPILHPLDWLLVRIRMRSGVRLCPRGCSPVRRWRTMWREHISDLTSIWCGPPTQTHYLMDEQPHVELESIVRFEPCGCEFREIEAPDRRPVGREADREYGVALAYGGGTSDA